MVLFGFIIAQIIIFVVILFVLKRLIFQDTDSAINRLTRLDTINREKEKKLGDKLEETDRLLKEKMEQLQEEEKRMKLEAERAANQMHDDIVKKARTEGEDILKKAFNSREKLRNDAMIEAASKMIEFSQELIAAVIGPMATKSINRDLVHEFLDELKKIDMTLVGSVRRVEIASSGPIEDEIIQQVKAILLEKLGKEVEIKVKEDVNLIAGVQMKFGSLVVDDSLRERLQIVAKKMKQDLTWKYKVKG